MLERKGLIDGLRHGAGAGTDGVASPGLGFSDERKREGDVPLSRLDGFWGEVLLGLSVPLRDGVLRRVGRLWGRRDGRDRGRSRRSAARCGRLRERRRRGHELRCLGGLWSVGERGRLGLRREGLAKRGGRRREDLLGDHGSGGAGRQDAGEAEGQDGHRSEGEGDQR